MELALIAFRQIFMMLILMTVGVGCAKTGLIDQQTNSKLSSLLLFIMAPAVIFMSFLRPLESELITGLMMALGLSVVSFIVKLVVTTIIYLKNTDTNRSLEKFACVYSNAGFIGIPLIQSVFGSEGVFYLTAYLTIFNLLNWTHGIMIMSGQMSFASFTKALRSPAIIAIAIGFTTFILQIEIPDLVIEPINMLAAMNAPLAMMVAGFAMSKANVKKIITNPKIYKVCFIRLILLPLIVIAIFSFFNIPIMISGTILIVTACPVGINIVLFAYRYKKDDTYATELMISSTILSMLTIPLLLFLI
jgi:predicted permease